MKSDCPATRFAKLSKALLCGFQWLTFQGSTLFPRGRCCRIARRWTVHSLQSRGNSANQFTPWIGLQRFHVPCKSPDELASAAVLAAPLPRKPRLGIPCLWKTYMIMFDCLRALSALLSCEQPIIIIHFEGITTKLLQATCSSITWYTKWGKTTSRLVIMLFDGMISRQSRLLLFRIFDGNQTMSEKTIKLTKSFRWEMSWEFYWK